MDVHDADWYAEHKVDLVLGTAATAVDTAAPRRSSSVDGRRIGYDKLLLATGRRARTLPLPGARGVTACSRCATSRTPTRSRPRSAPAAALAVIGGGWIGMETAANARDAGVEVTVIEAADLPLLAVLGPELAQVFLDLHREHGVEFQLGPASRRSR